GRKIAILDVSVGRDVGELTKLLNASIPGNDIHVRTVADSIILTGSVASAADAQKALDIASGFVGNGVASATSGADGISTKSISSGGKVINSLTIRGLDQVSLKVTVAEIRREIVKQLGVNISGSGPNGSIKIDNPFGLAAARLARAAAQAARDARLLLQPVARRRLGTVRAVLPQLAAKVRHFSLKRRNPPLQRGDQLFDFGRENHPILDSDSPPVVSENPPTKVPSTIPVTFRTHPAWELRFV